MHAARHLFLPPCCLLLAAALPRPVAAETPYALPRVQVTPLAAWHAGRLTADRIPANVRVLERDDADAPLSLNEMLDENVGSISIGDAQNNPLQPELGYRGFSISPLLGLPQGLAVYQSGTRINEAFGDTLNFDLVPAFAIDRIQLMPGSNPVYGLNALGGAISLDMKTGFSVAGTTLELLGGSFGRSRATVEHGSVSGERALYVGATHFAEDGWRAHSASEQLQVYADVTHRGERFEAGASLTLADTNLNGNGAAPVELLNVNREAVFTWPDNTANELAFLQLRAGYQLNDATTLQAGAYFRGLARDTANGDETDIETCVRDEALLCVDGDEPAPDINGNAIPAFIGDEPFGVFNRSRTRTDGHGLSAQATINGWGGQGNLFIAGIALDAATTAFENHAEIGELTESRTVAPAGVFLGGPAFNTVLDATSRHAGVYALNIFALTETLDLTLSGRFNHARAELVDGLGDDLTGSHTFTRFNPAAGLTWRATSGVTVFGGYSEANRAPTPAELSCADPEKPCRFPHAFVADPPLEQVVARTFEAGARGRSGAINWFGAAFVTVNDDDIRFVSSGPVVGSGYFRNAGRTRRRGVETGIEWRGERVEWFANYTWLDATFRDPFVIRSEHNPAANAEGDIQVHPGDRLPGIPAHSAKLGVTVDITPRWRAGLDGVVTSERFLRGDEGNDRPGVDGFAVIDLHASWRFSEAAEVFLLVENVLDTEYETFGTFGEADEVPLSELPAGADAPRFLGPGAPLGAWLGFRLSL